MPCLSNWSNIPYILSYDVTYIRMGRWRGVLWLLLGALLGGVRIIIILNCVICVCILHIVFE